MILSAQEAFLAKVRDLVVPFALSVQAREALLMEAFFTSHRWVLGEVLFDGTANEFAANCLTTLLLRDPTLTLLKILLITLQPMHGAEGQAAIQDLLVELPAFSTTHTSSAAATKNAQPAPQAVGGPSLFISYTAEDAERARWLADELARYGHTCRLERHPQKGSDGWLAATAASLSNAYAVLLLAGKETWQDRWVQVELLAALDKRKQIVPLLLRQGRLPGFIPNDIKPFDFTEMDEDHLKALLRRLPQPPSAATRTTWTPLSPALLQRADELVYMDRLKLEELRHVAQYTQLGGEAQLRRTRGDRLEVPTVVARQELVYSRWRRDLETPAETRRFEDAVPELQAIRRAVLLGEPGAGKTTTLYKLAADLIDAALLDRAAPVPLMVRLGLWTDPEESLEAFLRRSVDALGAELAARLREQRAALLLDGLNEIPAVQQAEKYRQVDEFLGRYPQLMAIASCREQDYPPERALALDVVTVAPLDPVRIAEFIHNYLDHDLGSQAADDLFWRLAGEDAQAIFQRFLSEHRFADEPESKAHTLFSVFWLADSLPQGVQWGYGDWSWKHWLRSRVRPASLLQLAQNPYMLFMLLDVFRTFARSLPDNRGELFDSFVETLLLRERLFALDRVTQTVVRRPEGINLLQGLTGLAYEMQRRRAAAGGMLEALTALPRETVAIFLDQQQCYQAASANLLALGEEVRFTHQLLQEYFVARAMGEQIFGRGSALQGAAAALQRLQAADIWPPARWWEPANWEEATILLAGLTSDDCTRVVQWAAQANPEVAARCIAESGAHTPEETKLALRELWLPRLVNRENDPDPRARAAVGRALGRITLADGQPLDNRPGVGFLVRDGVRLPDIAWGNPLPAGTYMVGGDEDTLASLDAREVTISSETVLARYPVTYAQFQCFVGAGDFADARWWAGMPPKEDIPSLETVFGETYQLRELSAQSFKFWNHPRESVSWYQAIAFCRWLSDKLGYVVDLPHEVEWEAAARYPDGRSFPWGSEFDAARANTFEDIRLGLTSAVGMYPQGANQTLELYDLSGNVWEWCRNKYGEPDEEWVDTEPVDRSGDERVVRGGSWDYSRNYARAAPRYARYDSHPAARYYNHGFRVVVRRPPSQDEQ